MIAVDTNVLVYAHREELPQHKQAVTWLKALAEGSAPWGIPVFCVGEFVRVVTHAKVFDPPSTIEQALAALESLLASPSLQILSPGSEYTQHFFECVREADARGNLVFDAQIVAVCRAHGCSALLTLDRDFARFKKFRTLSITEPPA
ncbi:MAG: hypothetical protein A2151_05660 [Candidatus Muproteobacteria bacterium RBG_16_65_34]|uniref:Ribonuclease VapC n=1 Tax=Candidatus Muproteobacteria bacterium RBG_16_65_34 TaxID=1817760 RepID=A0A1F6TV62_9PROT|nr:MAG: hypothetical protein A2151_05660 [Candidatus Muproteobacteria bacterium RBG_16_65_34]